MCFFAYSECEENTEIITKLTKQFELEVSIKSQTVYTQTANMCRKLK